MAVSLMNRAVVESKTLGVFGLSFNFVRSFSASASPSSQNPSSASSKPKRRKKKNLFEVAQFLPNWGIGYHMAKTHWTGVSYQITRINLYKDGRHGKAWGIVHKEGETSSPAAETPKKISGVHKRCWRYLPNLSRPAANTSNSIKHMESAPSS